MILKICKHAWLFFSGIFKKNGIRLFIGWLKDSIRLIHKQFKTYVLSNIKY